MIKAFPTILVAGVLLAKGGAGAQETVRLGNLKLAHFGAVSYISRPCSMR